MPRPVISAVDPHRMDPDSAALGVVLVVPPGAVAAEVRPVSDAAVT